MVLAGIAQWTDRLGAEDPRLRALDGLVIGTADLAGAMLGAADDMSIIVDADAAGHGWYADVSPMESSEFSVRLDRNVFGAARSSEAFGRMDLLTVVMHEIGHALGLSHEDVALYPVMREDLSPGVRIAWGEGAIAWDAAPSPWKASGLSAVQSLAEFRV